MEPSIRSRQSRRTAARWELAAVGAVIAVTFAASRRFDLFERFATWSRAHEGSVNLDEVLMSSVVGVLAVAVYAWRRFRETAEVECILASRTERYRSLFEYNPVAVFSLGPTGTFTAANPAALGLCGFSEEELLGTPFLDVVAEAERSSTARGFAHVMARRTKRFEMTLIHRDAHPVDLSVTTLPIVVDGDVVGVFGLAQDIGERVRTLRHLESARREAENASELKSLFVANVSHEIRTPLTSVLAATEMLGDTDLDADQELLLGRADRSGRRLLRLVEDLLDFSELAAGRASVLAGSYDPRALAARLGGWAEGAAAEKGLTWSCEVTAPPGACLTGDVDRVCQVATSLVENAVKFTAAGAVRVRIEVGGQAEAPASRAPAWVRIVVVDSGIGLSDEHQAHVFDSFSQVDGSIDRAYEGAGLGLAICRQTVALMGGSIWVESTLGVGSTFTVHLPQRPPVVPGSTPAPTAPVGGAHLGLAGASAR